MNNYLKILLYAPLIGLLVLFLLINTYIGELAVSFLPYILVFYGIFMISLTILFFLQKINFDSHSVYWLNWLIVFFVFMFIFSFYFKADPSVSASNMGIKTLSANLWYKNENNSELLRFFETEEADLVFVTEFTKSHYTYLKEYLDKNYPYKILQTTNLSQPYVGKAVFSKYPIEEVELEKHKYSELFQAVRVNFDTRSFVFVGVHTTAPASPDFYENRNEQLIYLGEKLTNEIDESIVISGDYNVSPWSIKFQNLKSDLGKYDIQKGDYDGLRFSWSLQAFPVLKSHIDHTFTSKDIKINSYDLREIPGSDHLAQTFEISL